MRGGREELRGAWAVRCAAGAALATVRGLGAAGAALVTGPVIVTNR